MMALKGKNIDPIKDRCNLLEKLVCPRFLRFFLTILNKKDN
jgi:hypothetical protein